MGVQVGSADELKRQGVFAGKDLAFPASSG